MEVGGVWCLSHPVQCWLLPSSLCWHQAAGGASVPFPGGRGDFSQDLGPVGTQEQYCCFWSWVMCAIPDSLLHVCASPGPRRSSEERQEWSPGEHEADPAGVPVVWTEQNWERTGRCQGKTVPGGNTREGYWRWEWETVRRGRAVAFCHRFQ